MKIIKELKEKNLQFSDSAVKEHLISEFKGDCAEMEGASIAHGAYLNNIPFVIIRAISDKADNSAEMDYSEFERKAIEHTVKLLTELINGKLKSIERKGNEIRITCPFHKDGKEDKKRFILKRDYKNWELINKLEKMKKPSFKFK